jgi:hypothetical protein
MAVEISVRTSDKVDDPVRALTAAHVEVHGLDPWTSDPTDDDPSNTKQAVFRIFADGPQAARDDGWSHAFTPSALGDHEWDGYIFPEAGTVTMRVFQLDDAGVPDDEVGSEAVEVVEPE